MIVDCFPFFNEIELLDIRLHELSDVVDCFVLVEATYTHSGNPKPLYYEQNKLRFVDYWSKITHLVVADMPITPDELKLARLLTDSGWADGDIIGDNWTRERFQRDAMMKILDQFSGNDIIILEDADEIVRKEVVGSLNSMLGKGVTSVEQSLHSYYLNWKCTNMPWAGTKIFRKRDMTTLSRDRFHTPANNTIHDGGWHFNFMGGVEAIRTKIRSYVHQEFNVPAVMDRIGWRLMDKKDALGRLYQYKVVEIDESYPQYIQDNLALFYILDWIY